MHISSSSAGLYPASLPVARKPTAQQLVPVETAAAKEVAEVLVPAQSAASDVKKEPPPVNIASLLEGRNIEGLNSKFTGSTQQQAVAAYTDVATQEHREELVALLGIDVFA